MKHKTFWRRDGMVMWLVRRCSCCSFTENSPLFMVLNCIIVLTHVHWKPFLKSTSRSSCARFFRFLPERSHLSLTSSLRITFCQGSLPSPLIGSFLVFAIISIMSKNLPAAALKFSGALCSSFVALDSYKTRFHGVLNDMPIMQSQTCFWRFKQS